jgi:roadblock/LC7 domain-containing protein
MRIGIEIPDDVYAMVAATIPAGELKTDGELKQGAFNRALVAYVRNAEKMRAELAAARRQADDLMAMMKAQATGAQAPATLSLSASAGGEGLLKKEAW